MFGFGNLLNNLFKQQAYNDISLICKADVYFKGRETETPNNHQFKAP